MSTYTHRIESVRTQMIQNNIDATIIPGSDPHLSEYLAEHWKIRNWLSGFTGSAGTLLITRTQSGLWTDSRYFLQAEEQLKESGIHLFKEGLPGVPSPLQWLIQQLCSGSRVAINGACFSKSLVSDMTQALKKNGIVLETQLTLAENLWTSRPPIPKPPITIHPESFAGKFCQEKINLVRARLEQEDATHYVVNTLDEIAWVLNLRGSDIPFNPVFHAFLIIEETHATLFINPEKLTDKVLDYLTNNGVQTLPYNKVYDYLSTLHGHSRVFLDPARTNAALCSALPSKITVKEGPGIINQLKGVKDEVEIQNIEKTMRIDGVAMVRFLMWLEKNVPKGTVTELSAANKLRSFRAQSDLFTGESFETISGYGAHGAIVHYAADAQSDIPLHSENLYLLDSGGQYLSGTTDITRTIALGPVQEQAKTDYTLVLQGHIALAQAIFPKGTRGAQLDILARQFLWNHHLNFGHGTGHGVGYYLNVHEGPQSIRTQDNGVTIKAGMLTSNEPGLYRDGRYGIRIENLMIAKEIHKNEFGTFLAFQTVTLCPIDTSLIRVKMLSDKEKKWLNDYHQRVYQQLAPELDKEEAEWLKSKTKAI